MENGYNKLLGLLKSRKFWALVIALIAVISGYALGEVNVWQALQGAIAALAAYSTGVAIEDAGRHVGMK